ncbi:hypothetical protein J2783_003020 [Chryseobacterium sediminis]|nr:hypothetical protein [Chryseobacterium sediminis]
MLSLDQILYEYTPEFGTERTCSGFYFAFENAIFIAR